MENVTIGMTSVIGIMATVVAIFVGFSLLWWRQRGKTSEYFRECATLQEELDVSRKALEKQIFSARSKQEHLNEEMARIRNQCYLQNFETHEIYLFLGGFFLEQEHCSCGVVRDDENRLIPFLVPDHVFEGFMPGDRFSMIQGSLVKVDVARSVTASPKPKPSKSKPEEFSEDATMAWPGEDAGDGKVSDEGATLFFSAETEHSFEEDALSGRPYLKVLKGENEGVEIKLPYSSIDIGRADENFLTLQDARSSRVHSKIHYQNHRFHLEDHQSTNGTYLNDEKISQSPLEFGDRIVIGDTELLFSCEGIDLKETRPKEAIAAFEQMVEKEPNFIDALKNLAFLLERDIARRKEAALIWEKMDRLKKKAEH